LGCGAGVTALRLYTSFVAALLSLFATLSAVAQADRPLPSTSVPAGPVPESWKLVEADDQRFRILLPAEPLRTENVRSTWVGSVSELRLQGELAGAEFIVEVRDLPPGTRFVVTRNYIFSQVKEGFLKDGERPEIFDKEITLGGYPGRHIRYEDPAREGGDWVEDALILLARHRLYFVVVARQRAREAALPIQAFFRSFELW